MKLEMIIMIIIIKVGVGLGSVCPLTPHVPVDKFSTTPWLD